MLKMIQRKFNVINEMHIMKRKTRMTKKMELPCRVAEYPPTVIILSVRTAECPSHQQHSGGDVGRVDTDGPRSVVPYLLHYLENLKRSRFLFVPL
jgi:hypothetical protein